MVMPTIHVIDILYSFICLNQHIHTFFNETSSLLRADERFIRPDFQSAGQIVISFNVYYQWISPLCDMLFLRSSSIVGTRDLAATAVFRAASDETVVVEPPAPPIVSPIGLVFAYPTMS